MSLVSQPRIGAASTAAGRPRATYRDNIILLVVVGVLEFGGLLDGWAHTTMPELETFLTPWHAVLAVGYGVTAGWIGLLVLRGWQRGARGLAAVPIGYGLGLVGAASWLVAFALDGLWHTAFGIEQGIEALLSPTHLLLAASEILMITCPWRAIWSDPASPRAPTFGAFLPVLVSAIFTAQVVGFFFTYEIAFLNVPSADDVPLGVSTVLTTNLILVGTMVLLLRRWQTPFGSFAVLFGAQALLLNGIVGFAAWPTIPIAFAGGLTADLLVNRLRPSPDRPAAFRAVPVLTSVVLWTVYMVAMRSIDALDLTLPVWSGAVILAAGSSFAVALLAAPPPVPETAEQAPA